MIKFAILENIIIFIIIFLAVWLLDTYWFFVLLIFINHGYSEKTTFKEDKLNEDNN